MLGFTSFVLLSTKAVNLLAEDSDDVIVVQVQLGLISIEHSDLLLELSEPGNVFIVCITQCLM